MYKQLEIYWVDLNPTQGSETNKKRPCVILQSDLLNKITNTVIVCPILPDHKSWPFAINIKCTKANGLDKDRHLNLKQIRAIDVSRLDNKQGELEKHYLTDIKDKLRIIFGIGHID